MNFHLLPPHKCGSANHHCSISLQKISCTFDNKMKMVQLEGTLQHFEFVQLCELVDVQKLNFYQTQKRRKTSLEFFDIKNGIKIDIIFVMLFKLATFIVQFVYRGYAVQVKVRNIATQMTVSGDNEKAFEISPSFLSIPVLWIPLDLIWRMSLKMIILILIQNIGDAHFLKAI